MARLSLRQHEHMWIGLRRLVEVFLPLALSVLLSQPLRADETAPTKTKHIDHPTVQSLSFMCGCWLAKAPSGDGAIEENWTKAIGNSMVGTCRFIERQQVRMFELLTIEDSVSSPVMRIRHFDAQLNAREEKSSPIQCNLESCTDQEAIFSCTSDPGGLKHLIYSRPAADTLNAIVEKERDGKISRNVFEYKRVESSLSPGR
jgi:hypothetical protein